MPINDDKFSGNIENLITIAAEVDNHNYFKEIIKALSFFLSHTNRNYYYTETYLTDQYQNFESFLKRFHKKSLFLDGLYNYLQRNLIIDDKQLCIRVTIDEIWEINYKENRWYTTLRNRNLNYMLKNVVYVSFELSQRENKIEMYEEFDINEINKELKIYQQIEKYYNQLAECEESNNEEGKNKKQQVV